MLKTIVFDFDGTLADSKEAFLSAYNQIAERHGYLAMTWALFDELKKLSIKERCSALGIPLHKIPFLIGELSKQYKESLKYIQMMDGAADMLRELSELGYELAIISSNEEKNIRTFLQIHELNYFSTIMCSKKLFAKDRLMRKYVKHNNFDVSQVLYVGDEERDIVASKKCGIKVIWAKWGFDSIENVRNAEPDYIAERPEDVVHIVQALSN